MDHLVAAAPAEYRPDLVGPVAGDARTTAESPRRKVPSTERTPARSNDRPAAKARAAPASITNGPSGTSVPAIQRLRADWFAFHCA